jgi:hypothetical protein
LVRISLLELRKDEYEELLGKFENLVIVRAESLLKIETGELNNES